MILTQAQKLIAKEKARFRVINCGRRFGKTTLAVLEMCGKALAKDNQRIAYFATTYQQARDIAWDLLRKLAFPITVVANESRLELTVRTQQGGTSQIWLRGWENVETARGQQFDFLVMDEVASMKKWKSNWQEILRPTLTDTRGKGMFISTPKGFNHFYELYNQEQQDKDFKSFHFTSYDNPFLPIEELEKARIELTEDAFAQEYLADFRKHTGLIYKDFDRSIHVIEPRDFPPVWRTYRTMDFGGHNPTVCLWIKADNQDTLYIYDEYYESERTTDFHAGVINAKTAKTPILITFGDPSGHQSILDYGIYGINIAPAIKIYNQQEDWVGSGIKKVQEYLKPHPNTNKPRLYVTSNCRNTIREFETYHWLETKTNDISKDIPEKRDDHAMDALRYMVCSFDGQAYSEETLDLKTIINPNSFTGY